MSFRYYAIAYSYTDQPPTDFTPGGGGSRILLLLFLRRRKWGTNDSFKMGGGTTFLNLLTSPTHCHKGRLLRKKKGTIWDLCTESMIVAYQRGWHRGLAPIINSPLNYARKDHGLPRFFFYLLTPSPPPCMTIVELPLTLPSIYFNSYRL